MNRLILISAAGLCLGLHVGCSTVQSIPARMKSVVSGTPDRNDPLATLPDEVSGSYKSAKKELKKADQTLLKFARWREDMGDYVEARQQYKNILVDNPHNADARLGIARVEFATGRVAEATEILMATARQHPHRADVWVELGSMQSERQQWGQAVQSLQKAVEIEPDNEIAGYQLGVALARSDRVEEARPYLAAAVGESAALYNIGYVLHEADRDEEAAHWFRQALNSHPDQRTRALSAQMLAQLSANDGTDRDSHNVAKLRPQINVELTSYEAWRDIPGQPRPSTDGSIAVTPSGHPPAHATPLVNPAAQFDNQPTVSPAATQTPQWQGPGVNGTPPAYEPATNTTPQTPIEPQPWRGGGR